MKSPMSTPDCGAYGGNIIRVVTDSIALVHCMSV